MRIKRIHRITLAVRDVEAARATFERLFSAETLGGAATVPAFGIRALDLQLGDDTLQLAAPLGADNPVVRFLERKGEGFYNIALEVNDLDASVAELAALGVRVSEPTESEPGLRSAFLTMSATHGLSVQLVELARPALEPVAVPPAEAPGVPPEPVPAAGPPAVEQQEPAHAAAPPDERPAPLDLTPDEWSDVD